MILFLQRLYLSTMTRTQGNSDYHSSTNKINKKKVATPNEQSTQNNLNAEKEKFHQSNFHSSLIESDLDSDIFGFIG